MRLCGKCGIKWIGPGAEAMDAMGDKANAKATMIKAGVPVVMGSEGVVTDLDEAKLIAKEVGYPVLVKASAGGGGGRQHPPASRERHQNDQKRGIKLAVSVKGHTHR